MSAAKAGRDRQVDRELPARPAFFQKESPVLETIAVIFLILWLLGLVSGATFNGFIYVLLVIAIVLILVRLITGKV